MRERLRGETCLVLREGNTVVFLERPTDLTDPACLAELCPPLQWEV